MAIRFFILAFAFAVSAARADGLDRDTLLTEAPATPAKGTLRLSAGARSESQDTGNSTRVTGSLMWAPISRLAADVGTYWQGTGDNGPTVRVRAQLLAQETAGIDLGVGARFKKAGFFKAPTDGSPNGELEFLVAAGRRIGAFDLVLNGVFGMETGGPGKDLEAKAFFGYRLLENVRAGLDARLQAEFVDENGTKVPTSADMDLRAGPAVSWLIARTLQLQALIGGAKPKGTTKAAATGMLLASLDF
jgi:hypothetical protein